MRARRSVCSQASYMISCACSVALLARFPVKADMKPSMARRSGSLTVVDALAAGFAGDFGRRGFFDTGMSLAPETGNVLENRGARIAVRVGDRLVHAPQHRTFHGISRPRLRRLPPR